jgi:hypothetical protein
VPINLHARMRRIRFEFCCCHFPLFWPLCSQPSALHTSYSTLDLYSSLLSSHRLVVAMMLHIIRPFLG